MTKEELVEFLKENLNIVIQWDTGYYYAIPSLKVKLGLADTIISEYSCDLYGVLYEK